MSSGVRVVHAALIVVVVLLLGWAGLDLWLRRGGYLLQTSWATAIVLAVMALVVGWLGWQMHRYLAGKGTPREVTPQRARATLVAAQSAVFAGSVFAGWYAAHVLVLLQNADIPTQRAQMWRYLAAGVAALGVVAAGFAAQWACRIDPPEDPEAAESGGVSGPRGRRSEPLAP